MENVCLNALKACFQSIKMELITACITVLKDLERIITILHAQTAHQFHSVMHVFRNTENLKNALSVQVTQTLMKQARTALTEILTRLLRTQQFLYREFTTIVLQSVLTANGTSNWVRLCVQTAMVITSSLMEPAQIIVETSVYSATTSQVLSYA